VKPQRASLLPASLPPEGISREQAAEFIGVSPNFFDQLVKDGRMPQPRRVGSRRVWSVAELRYCFHALPNNGNVDGSEFDGGRDAYDQVFA
jgi:hypothetical protein